MQTFFYPSLLFLMTTYQLQQCEWHQIDDKTIAEQNFISRWIQPVNTSILYGSRNDNTFVLPLAAEDYNISHIDRVFKLLTSKHQIVCDIARVKLRKTANYRHDSTMVEKQQDFPTLYQAIKFVTNINHRHIKLQNICKWQKSNFFSSVKKYCRNNLTTLPAAQCYCCQD